MISGKRKVSRATPAVENVYRSLIKFIQFAGMLEQLQELVDLGKFRMHSGPDSPLFVHDPYSLQKWIRPVSRQWQLLTQVMGETWFKVGNGGFLAMHDGLALFSDLYVQKLLCRLDRDWIES